MRGNDRKIAVRLLNFSEEILKSFPEGSTLWQPQRQTLANPCGEGEEFHFLTYLAVVPFLRLLKHCEVFVKH